MWRCAATEEGPGARRRFRLRAHAAARRGGGERRAALFPRRVRADPPPLVLVRRDDGRRGVCSCGCPIMRCRGSTGCRPGCCSRTSRRWRKRSTCSSACATGWWSSAASPSRRDYEAALRMRHDVSLLPKPFQLSRPHRRATCSSSRRGSALPCARWSRRRRRWRAATRRERRRDEMGADHRRRGGGAGAVPARHRERRHRGVRAAVSAAPRAERGARRAARRAGRLPARRHCAALPGAGVRHAPHAAPAGALRRARGGAGPHRLRRVGPVPHPLDRIVVRRQGRRGARRRHQPRRSRRSTR